MISYLLNHKTFFTAIIMEVIVILFIAISSLGERVNIELKADDFEIYDSTAYIKEYEPVDSLVKDKNTLLVYDNKETQDIEKSIYISCTDEESAYGRWIVGSGLLSLRPGMYEVEAKYYSLWYNEDGGSSDNSSGIVNIISEKNASFIYYNDMKLTDNVTVNQQRLWIRSIKSIDDVQIKVAYYGLGELRIDSIAIRELPLWRVLKLLTWIFGFIGIDIIYILLFTDNNIRNKEIALGLVLTAIFSCLPVSVYTKYLFSGQDVDFHIARIWALAENIKAGKIAYPIQIEMINGYGYASPIFYGQLLLYIPAFIYLMGAPMQVCFQMYIVIVNLATLIVSYYCLKAMVDDCGIAAIGASLYVMAPYRITNVLIRGAAGEYSAMIFLPLVIYGFVKIYSKDTQTITWKECLAEIIGLTGLIQTHVLMCEMLATFIVLLCIIEFRKTFELRRFVALACTAITTALLNAAFLIPFIDSMSMNLKIMMLGADKMQSLGAYLIQILGVFMTNGASTSIGRQGGMSMTLGFSLVIGMVILLYCCINKYKWDIVGNTYLRIGTISIGFAICSIVMSLSVFPWDSLELISPILAKIYCAIQFPWRYLSLATIFTLVVTVSGLKVIKDHISSGTMMFIEAMLVAFMVIQVGNFYINYNNSGEEITVYGGADIAKDDIGSGEYRLGNDETDTVEDELKWKTIKADLTNVNISNYSEDKGIVTFVCDNMSDTKQLVQIPILNYDNYHAYLEDGTELEIENGDNNRIGIWVPSGYNGIIGVQYEIPLLWKISNLITFITFISMVVTPILLNRRERNKENKYKTTIAA